VFLGVVGARVIGLHGGAGTDAALVLPLLATQILWINLITDSGPALAMGIDRPGGGLMARPPRRPTERAIDARMWRGVVAVGLVMALATLLTIDLNLPGGLIEGTHNLASARTAGFTVLVFAQLFNCFNARSETASAFDGLFENGWLWAAVVLSIVLQVAVVNVELLNAAFGTVPLSITQWAVCVAMASAVLWFGELRKAWLRA
jgi:P-type Ca2+ transporter type 2C